MYRRHEPCRGVGGVPSPENFQIGDDETLFSALVMRYVSEKATSNKCEKAGVFSAYKCLFPRSC